MSPTKFEKVTCPDCRGERLVVIDGDTFTCSTCYGDGTVWPRPYAKGNPPDMSLGTDLGAVFALDLLRALRRNVEKELHFADRTPFLRLIDKTAADIRSKFDG
jgi:hypothetical protein